MLTTLPKHRGSKGPLIAFGVLVTTTAVVLYTSPSKPTPKVEQAPRPVVTAPVAELPAAMPMPAPLPPPSTASKLSGTGIIGYDENRTSHLTAPVAGWLQKARAKSVGRTIRAGETLGWIESPEIYLTSVEVLKQLRDYHGQESLDAERTRLLRMGMTPWALTKMQKTGKPETSVPLISRVNGVVVAEQGEAKMLVDPWQGLELFTITDPSRYWLYIDLPAQDAARVNVGAKAAVTLEGAAPISANVGYVFRRVDDGLRTVRIDIQSKKPLKINTSARAEIKL